MSFEESDKQEGSLLVFTPVKFTGKEEISQNYRPFLNFRRPLGLFTRFLCFRNGSPAWQVKSAFRAVLRTACVVAVWNVPSEFSAKTGLSEGDCSRGLHSAWTNAQMSSDIYRLLGQREEVNHWGRTAVSLLDSSSVSLECLDLDSENWEFLWFSLYSLRQCTLPSSKYTPLIYFPSSQK